MTPATSTILGLVANLPGVLLLFLFGMSFRVRTGGHFINWTTENVDHRTIRAEGVSDAAGCFALVLTLLGTSMQIYATVLGR